MNSYSTTHAVLGIVTKKKKRKKKIRCLSSISERTQRNLIWKKKYIYWFSKHDNFLSFHWNSHGLFPRGNKVNKWIKKKGKRKVKGRQKRRKKPSYRSLSSKDITNNGNYLLSCSANWVLLCPRHWYCGESGSVPFSQNLL